jgi:hypothetical protein
LLSRAEWNVMMVVVVGSATVVVEVVVVAPESVELVVPADVFSFTASFPPPPHAANRARDATTPRARPENNWNLRIGHQYLNEQTESHATWQIFIQFAPDARTSSSHHPVLRSQDYVTLGFCQNELGQAQETANARLELRWICVKDS